MSERPSVGRRSRAKHGQRSERSPSGPLRKQQEREATSFTTHPGRARTGGTFASLRHREFRLFFSGQLVSVIGIWVHQVAETWLVLELTGSGLAAGAVAACRFLPVLGAGLWGGVLADRHDRRMLLLVTQSIRGLAAGALGVVTVAGMVTPPMVYAAALVSGGTNAVDNPARRAFIKDLVPPDDLVNAVSLNSSVMATSRVLAPLLGAATITSVGVGWCFVLNALSYVAVIASLARMRPATAHADHDGARPERRGAVVAALRYARRNDAILAVLVLVGVVNAFAWNWEVLLALHAERTFAGGAGLYGALFATFSLGTLVGALVTASRGSATPRHVVRVALLQAVCTGAAALVPGLLPAFVALFATGVVGAVFTTSSNAVLQLETDPSFHGRVMAMYSVLFVGTKGIGGVIVGGIAGAAGVRWGIATGAVAVATAVAVLAGRGTRPAH